VAWDTLTLPFGAVLVASTGTGVSNLVNKERGGITSPKLQFVPLLRLQPRQRLHNRRIVPHHIQSIFLTQELLRRCLNRNQVLEIKMKIDKLSLRSRELRSDLSNHLPSLSLDRAAT
jgi:hypothetical protein